MIELPPTKPNQLLFSAIKTYLTEVAERHSVDINTLTIEYSYDNLYINSVTGYNGCDVRQLQIFNLKEMA